MQNKSNEDKTSYAVSGQDEPVVMCKFISELAEEMNSANSEWKILGIVDTPKGERQDEEFTFCDHSFVKQKCGVCEDDYYGEIYIPIGNKYIEIHYVC